MELITTEGTKHHDSRYLWPEAKLGLFNEALDLVLGEVAWVDGDVVEQWCSREYWSASPREILGEDFGAVFDEVDRNFLVSEEFVSLHEDYILAGIEGSASAWGSDAARMLAQLRQTPTPSPGIFEGLANIVKAVFNMVLMGLAILLMLAVVVAVGIWLLLRVWDSVFATVKSLVAGVWRLIQYRKDAEVADRLLAVQERVEGIESKVGRDAKRLEEVRALKFEVVRMREAVQAARA